LKIFSECESREKKLYTANRGAAGEGSMRRFAKIAVFLSAVLFVAGCATQPPPVLPNVVAPGFFYGLFHGFVAPFAMVGSFFMDDVRMYAYPNTGHYYDLGFVLGFLGLASAGVV
jgi:hypothetical protein